MFNAKIQEILIDVRGENLEKLTVDNPASGQ
jgi:hypothetical protein